MNVLFLTDAYLADFTLDNFRQAVLDSIIDAGNDTTTVIANRYLNEGRMQFFSDKARDEFFDRTTSKKFDLIITLNHAGMKEEFPFVRDETPVLTWYIDSPRRVPQQLLNHKKNELAFIPDKTYLEVLASLPGLDDKRVFYLPFGTTKSVVNAPKIENASMYEAEISFVGSYFSIRPFLDFIKTLNTESAHRFLEVVDQHFEDYHRPLADILEAHHLTLTKDMGVGDANSWAVHLLRAIDDYKSSQLRADYLVPVAKRNLKIYGNEEWCDAAIRCPDLLRCFQFREARPAELPHIYRNSKILLNICHVQARQGVPFRVFDIMGCGGFLLSEHRSDLATLFQEDVELCVFHNADELGEKASYYLEHDAKRREIGDVARAKVLNEHLVTHRIQSLFEHANERLI